MALTYSFYSSQKIEITVLNQAAKQAVRMGNQSSSFVDIAIMRLDDYEKGLIDSQYGFPPLSGLLFRLDKFAEDDLAFLEMLRLALLLIEEKIENALLVFDGEIPVFLKIGERFVLNSSRSFWDDPIRLEQIKTKYELHPLANLA